MSDVVLVVSLRMITAVSRLLGAAEPYVNDRARTLSDAANEDTAKYEALMPAILVVVGIIALALFSYWLVTRDSNGKK